MNRYKIYRTAFKILKEVQCISKEHHLLIDYCQIFSQIRLVLSFLQLIKANKSYEPNKMEGFEYKLLCCPRSTGRFVLTN